MTIEQEMREYLKKITGLEVTPVFCLGPYPAIAYKVTPVDGGVVKQYQLEARVIGKDFDELLEIKQKLIDRLDMTERDPSIELNSIVFRSILAGGGDLFNPEIQMWESPTIFILTWRCK